MIKRGACSVEKRLVEEEVVHGDGGNRHTEQGVGVDLVVRIYVRKVWDTIRNEQVHKKEGNQRLDQSVSYEVRPLIRPPINQDMGYIEPTVSHHHRGGVLGVELEVEVEVELQSKPSINLVQKNVLRLLQYLDCLSLEVEAEAEAEVP